jgi:hypothetical protein
VRCPEPRDVAGNRLAQDKMVMLCSFHEDYNDHWRYVSEEVIIRNTLKSLERMLDISSPRLVGLALYESIRWTPCCIVDWTHWRANVFFELGVRLACSDIGPICLVEEAETHKAQDEAAPSLKQHHQLITLLRPTLYRLGGPGEPFEDAFRRYEAIITGQDVSIEDTAIAHNSVYQTVVASYYWEQESISRRPHEELIANVQAQFGKDPQKQGRSQVLFSTNPEFAKALRHNVQERWIAAWYYFNGRYSIEEFRADVELREQLIKLGEEVAQWLPKTPDYERIRREIFAIIEELEKL